MTPRSRSGRGWLPFLVLLAAVGIIAFFVWSPGWRRPVPAPAWGGRIFGLLQADGQAPMDPALAVLPPIERARAPVAARFDFPVGSEHGALTYNAQPFRITRHLGEDLNGIGGQNSDLGDPVYAAADGWVTLAGQASEGWGNVLALLHRLPPGQDGETARTVTTFYGHLESIHVGPGTRVTRGQQIGAVGTANGKYLAHLHFELRQWPALDAGPGYADSPLDRLPAELRVQDWRGAPNDQLNPAILVEEGAAPELEPILITPAGPNETHSAPSPPSP